MIAFLKGLVPGALLTWIVSTLVGSNGSAGGILAIHRLDVMHHPMYWSWPLFVAATLLAATMFFLTE